MQKRAPVCRVAGAGAPATQYGREATPVGYQHTWRRVSPQIAGAWGQELSALGGAEVRSPESMGPVADGAPGVEPGRRGLGQQERPSRLGAAGYRASLSGGGSLSRSQHDRPYK